MSGSIGPHTFALLKGEVQTVSPQVELLVTLGEDGQRRRLTGIRGEPFQMTSSGHYATKTAAEVAVRVFREMKAEVVQDIVKDGFNFNVDAPANFKEQVAVLDVQKESIRKVVEICDTANTWWLVCNWTLVMVRVG